MPDDDEMTVSQAAALLGITRGAMSRGIRRHKIPSRKLGERIVLVKRADIDAYLGSRNRPAPKRPA